MGGWAGSAAGREAARECEHQPRQPPCAAAGKNWAETRGRAARHLQLGACSTHLAKPGARLPDVVREPPLAVAADVGDHAAVLHHLLPHGAQDLRQVLLAQPRLGLHRGKRVAARGEAGLAAAAHGVLNPWEAHCAACRSSAEAAAVRMHNVRRWRGPRSSAGGGCMPAQPAASPSRAGRSPERTARRMA